VRSGSGAPQRETIQVEVRGDAPGQEVPIRLIWRGVPFRVTAVEATWCADGKWWLDSSRKGVHRRYYRVSVLSPNCTPLCVEVYRSRNSWVMWRLLD
jgi:hypothetical protein